MQQVGVLVKFFSHTIPDVLEESGLTQVCPKTSVDAARGVGNHISLRIVIMETCWNESYTTGTLQWRTTNFTEEIDWEGAGVLHSLIRNGWIVKGSF